MEINQEKGKSAKNKQGETVTPELSSEIIHVLRFIICKWRKEFFCETKYFDDKSIRSLDISCAPSINSTKKNR